MLAFRAWGDEMRREVVTRADLGKTGLSVSRLAFGTGYLGGPIATGARLLVQAYDLGVNFWDTSDDYGTHPHVARALREVGRQDVVVATKTYATTASGARRAVTKALRELRTDTVDVFLLHAVDSVDDLEAKRPAIRRLYRTGRGVYGMKALGSGQVTGADVAPALRWAFRFPYAHSICIGMTTANELRTDVALCRGAQP